jgi:hypothetical protein
VSGQIGHEMACTRQLFERGGHITTKICSSTAAAGSRSSKAIWQRLILRLYAPFVVSLVSRIYGPILALEVVQACDRVPFP